MNRPGFTNTLFATWVVADALKQNADARAAAMADAIDDETAILEADIDIKMARIERMEVLLDECDRLDRIEAIEASRQRKAALLGGLKRLRIRSG